MTSFRTRSLLAALLLLGQLAGLLHGLEHGGYPEGADHRAHAHAFHAHGDSFRAHAPHVHDGDTFRAHAHAWHEEEPAAPAERSDALCGLCLLATAGIALVDTANAPRPIALARVRGFALAGGPSPRDRARLPLARGPPRALS